MMNTLNLGKITLGTMRFVDKNLSIKETVKLIEESFNLGINTHHSSFEYNSYSLYANALNKSSCKPHIKHIVKLSSPHFGESKFSAEKLEKLIDNELKHLKVDCIDVLQWLVRSEPINDNDRLSVLLHQKEAIEASLSSLKEKGKIKHVFAFPYSVNFAHEVIKLKSVDGIISYLNKSETDYSHFANSVPFIAIRPFFAGKLFNDASNTSENIISDCLDYVYKHKSVKTSIISINTIQQLNQYKNYLKKS